MSRTPWLVVRLATLLAPLAVAAPATAQGIAPEAYLKPLPNAPNLRSGTSVALSGDTLVVGAAHAFGGTTGAGECHVFVREATGWVHQARLEASNPTDADRFGAAVAIRGDTIVVGAPQEDTLHVDSGAAYVFERTGTTWAQQALLKSTNPGPFDEFGVAVGLSGDRIVVGARYEDSSAVGVDGDKTDNSAASAGAAYVYRRTGASWIPEAYLKASSTDSNDQFASSVAIDGDTIVVGSAREDSAATGVDGSPHDDSAADAGAAYVFTRSGTTWSQQAYLKASNTETFDRFGGSVGIHADTIVIGAGGEDSSATGANGDENDNGASSAGAAYVFARTGTTWSQQAYLKASNTEAGDAFGLVSVWNDHLVVGAVLEDSEATGVNGDEDGDSHLSTQAGAAYLFVRTGTAWAQLAYLKASNTGANDSFGTSVAVHGSNVVVGASTEDGSAAGVNGPYDDLFSNSGAAYAFRIADHPGVYCSAKASSIGCLAAISTSSPTSDPISGGGGYDVIATGVHSLKNGLLFAGTTGAGNTPFSGGILCVAPPLKRGPIVGSGGGDPDNCSGSFATEVNDGQIVPAGLDAGPGNTGWYQYWYRDPQNGAGTLGTALSNAVQLDFL